MISLPQGFKINNPEAVDSRLILSKSEMLNVNSVLMPSVYFAVCKDDSNLYIYNASNEVDEETGRFRLYAANDSEDVEAESITSAQIQSLFKKENEENG